MRTTLARRRTVRVAAMAASLALVAAACTKPGPKSNDPDGSSVVGGIELTAGTLLVSNGTNEVSIGGQTVTFPSTVTDAAWSEDGSRIAYINGDGNVATAKPDGSGVVVLTATNSSVVRSRPSWSRAWIFYAEKKIDGTSALMSVPTNGCGGQGLPATGEAWPMDTGDGTSYVDVAPSAATSLRPSRVAFQHNEPSGPEVWINDTNQRVPVTYKVGNGSEPALSWDGTKLAYVGTNGQVFVTTPGENASPGVQITFGANQPTYLVWNPDGGHLAYRTTSAIESVGVSPGSGSNPATTLSTGTGVAAYLAGTKNTANRLSAADAIALSVGVSQARWPTAKEFAFGQEYPGAFGATITVESGAMGAIGVANYPGPLLLTAGTSLDPRTKAELQRIFGKIIPNAMQPEITIVGNEVSAGVEQALTDMGYHVTRKSGQPSSGAPDGVCGSQVGAGLLNRTVVVVDTSSTTEESLATSLARSWQAPVIRVNGGTLADDQRDYLGRSSGSLETVYIVGGTAISADLEKLIGDAISGPLGFTTSTNPTAPALFS